MKEQLDANTVTIGLDVVLGIVAAIVPFGVLPLWVGLLVPVLQADIPAAEALFEDITTALQKAQAANTAPQVVLAGLREALVKE